MRLTQGSPPALAGICSCQGYHKTEPIRRSRSGEGAEGGRSTGSTDDSGPMKPGNRVEDKTLTTRKILGGGECFWQRTRRLTNGHMNFDPKPNPSEIKPGRPNFRRWDVGSRGRKAMVIPLKSRIRVAKKDERNQQTEGG